MADTKTNPASVNQAYLAMPRLDTPFIDVGGRVSPPWYLFLVSLWQKIGGSNTTLQGTVVLTNEGGNLMAQQSFTGDVVGEIVTVGSKDADSLVMEAISFGTPKDDVIPPPAPDPLLPLAIAVPE